MAGSKKSIIITLVVIVLVAVVAVVAYHCYQESQKSDLEKAAESTSNMIDNAANDTNKAVKDLTK